jgi:hypothetical protein
MAVGRSTIVAMKPASVLAASLVAWLLPSVALACPGMSADGHGGCGLGSLGGYLAAVAIGLLVGIGSVAVEKSLRSR